MHKSERIRAMKIKVFPPRRHSMDDIDELTYRHKVTTKEEGKHAVHDIAPFGKNISSQKWLPETESLPEHTEVYHQLKDKDKDDETKSASSESVEQQVSEVSIRDKIRCMKFADMEFFAEMFVDEIIDISIDVCQNLEKAAISEDGESIGTPCICGDAPSEEADAAPVEHTSVSSAEKFEFSGWPTIKHFTVGGAKKKILEFMTQWYFVEDWKYNVRYIASYSDTISDYHLFEGIWSIPTKEYPIAQATATVFFTIEVSRVKPKYSLVDVTLQFEGSNSVYKAGQFEFIEAWLFNIVDSKLNLFRTLKF